MYFRADAETLTSSSLVGRKYISPSLSDFDERRKTGSDGEMYFRADAETLTSSSLVGSSRRMNSRSMCTPPAMSSVSMYAGFAAYIDTLDIAGGVHIDREVILRELPTKLDEVKVSASARKYISPSLPVFRRSSKSDSDGEMYFLPTKLDEVKVSASARKYISPSLSDFDERRKTGSGHFITEEEMRKNDDHPLLN